MSHNPELDAATYLGGAMSPQRAEAFERHLLECEDCWGEVSVAREGRALAERARELAPVELREDLRASIAAYQPERWHRGRAWLAVAAAFVLLVGGGSFFVATRSPSQPAAIAAAVADFQTGRLPVAGTPTRPGPDLSSAGLHLTSSGSGRIGDLRIDAYDYRDAEGQRVLLYLSDRPFPVAAGARHYDGADAPWTARDGDVELLCAQRPHPLLLLSEHGEALQRAAESLGVT